VTITEFEHVKTAVVGAWILAWGVVALSVNVNSASSWVLLIGLGVLPPLLLLRMWRQPTQSLSESIREVLK
jgi:hypothetical protein